MEELRAYLNSLSTAEQEQYARLCGTSIGYLRKALSVGQKFKAELAIALADNSGGRVTRYGLRPDVFQPSHPTKRRAA